MAIQKTTGIVLRRHDLRETSLLISLYTRDYGKINGLIRGVRGPRAPHGSGGLELFAHDEIVFYERKQSDIYTISQCDLIDFFFPVRVDLERLAYASYMVELLDSVTVLSDSNRGIFDLLLNSLRFLEERMSAKRVARVFEIKLLALLGIMPVLKACVQCQKAYATTARFSLRRGGIVCAECQKKEEPTLPILPGSVKFIEHVKELSFDKVSRIKVSHEVGRQVEMILRKFLDFHIERRMKTLDFLKEIGS